MFRNLSDTARLTAVYRACETERADPLFQDPLAHRLAGTLGREFADEMSAATRYSWVIVVRTLLFDRLILAQIDRGVDTVINLAAGFDTRPYRLPLPASLRWVEVDLPEILAEKTALLDGERPACELSHVALDLSDRAARRPVLEGLCGQARAALVITEGLLIYLAPADVATLSADIAALPSVGQWMIDLQSPNLLRLAQRAVGRRFEDGAAPLAFAPADGAAFFQAQGWYAIEDRSITEAAAALGRLPSWSPLSTTRTTSIDGRVCVLARA